MLAPIIVDTNSDTHIAGKTTLREAIQAANVSSDANEIEFAANLDGATITLTQNQLTILNPLTIDGTDANGIPRNIIINGGNGTDHLPGTFDGHRVFVINGAVVTFRGHTITGGDTTSANGGAIYTAGLLTLQDTTITGNAVFNGGGTIAAFALAA